jgi:SAM-dependent methyltransferase
MSGLIEHHENYIDPEIYDDAYSWYTVDIPFYVERARQARGPVLEVACGTGRILIPTMQAGVDIDGFDLHPGMLEVLRRKARLQSLEPRIVQADMRDFTMPRRYRLITIPFRAFMHLVEARDQLRALRCIREHLEPGGSLLFNVFHPDLAALGNPEGSAVHGDRTIVDPETGVTRVLHMVSIDVDRARQVNHVERELHVLDSSGAVLARNPHRFEMRWLFKAEMELLLDKAGFNRWDVRGGFDDRPFDRDSDEMVWTAWKD